MEPWRACTPFARVPGSSAQRGDEQHRTRQADTRCACIPCRQGGKKKSPSKTNKKGGKDIGTATKGKIAQIVAETTAKAVLSATEALREKLLQDETVQVVSKLEPVALDVTKVVDAAVKESNGDEATARTKIAQIVSDTTNEAVTAIAALRETLMQDETIKTVASLEPVSLDVSKVVSTAVAQSGGDEATARTKIAQIVADTQNKAVLSATAALREKLLQDETVQIVSKLEPVALDVTKVVDAAVKVSGGDEVCALLFQLLRPLCAHYSAPEYARSPFSVAFVCSGNGAYEDRHDRCRHDERGGDRDRRFA